MNEDKSVRYQRLKRRGALVALGWRVAVLVGLLWSGVSVALRSAAEAITGALPGTGQPVAIALYVAGVMAIHECGASPVGFYLRFWLERRYGLSNERFFSWFRDHLKAFAVAFAIAVLVANIVYAFIRHAPEHWWLPAGALFCVLIIALTNLAPVLFLPLFYRMKPLDREALRARLFRLAERAGAPVLGAYEWGMAEKTRKANAALAGLGRTRRILVSDTMLADYSDEEIEVVLAHEMAHHIHGDIWKGVVFEGALVMLASFVASQALSMGVNVLDLRNTADIAGLPVLLLAGGAVSLFLLPAANALSRAHERSADRFALELTQNPAAFVSAMRRLAAQNLAEDQPSRIVQWLFCSHPSIHERIAAARAFTVAYPPAR